MTQAKNNVCRCFGVIALITLLTGCANLELENGTWADRDRPGTQTDTTTPVERDNGQISTTGQLSAQELEQSALTKATPEKEELLLFAVSAYLDQGNIEKAGDLLELTNQNKLPELLQLRKEVLYAALAIEENKLDQAEQILKRLNAYKNSDPVFNDWIVLAESKLLQRQGNFPKLLELLTAQTATIDDANKQQHLTEIWNLVKEQSLEQLNQSRLATSREIELGWIELGIIEKKRELIPPAIWQQSLSLWESAYKDHPGIEIYTELSETVSIELDDSGLSTSNTIALLLPLSSPYKEIAATIRDGFKAAALTRGNRVRVYDTGSNLEQVVSKYEQAVAQGAQIIVGPLGKTAASKLAAEVSIFKPTLLLGSVDSSEDTILTPETFMFSLDPEHEAESIANLAYNRGYNRAAVLYPESSRGKRLNNAFSRRWRELGGVMSASVAYDNDLYEAVTPVDRLLSSSSPDVIFLASNAQQGRLLSQVIGKRRPNTAIFATSSIYSGQSDPTRDFVLDNVIFTDMPWMIKGFSNAQFRKQQLAAERFESPNSLDRYFAFGVDAFALASRLPQFMQQPGVSIKGVTGTIQARGNRFALTRPLVQFVDGTPKPIN